LDHHLVSNFLKQCSNVRPVIYITPEKWDAICEGENIITVAQNLTSDADLCISKFKTDLITAPVLPDYSKKLYFWEWKNGYFTQDTDGFTCADSYETSSDDDSDGSDDSGDGDDSGDSTTISGAVSINAYVQAVVTMMSAGLITSDEARAMLVAKNILPSTEVTSSSATETKTAESVTAEAKTVSEIPALTLLRRVNSQSNNKKPAFSRAFCVTEL
jgi:hypothetical protein